MIKSISSVIAFALALRGLTDAGAFAASLVCFGAAAIALLLGRGGYRVLPMTGCSIGWSSACR